MIYSRGYKVFGISIGYQRAKLTDFFYFGNPMCPKMAKFAQK